MRHRLVISKKIRDEKLEEFNRNGRICGICHEMVIIDDSIHLDHITPYSISHDNSLSNLQYTHSSCNLAKKTKTGYQAERVLSIYKFCGKYWRIGNFRPHQIYGVRKSVEYMLTNWTTDLPHGLEPPMETEDRYSVLYSLGFIQLVNWIEQGLPYADNSEQWHKGYTDEIVTEFDRNTISFAKA
jgi:hypothetical protein